MLPSGVSRRPLRLRDWWLAPVGLALALAGSYLQGAADSELWRGLGFGARPLGFVLFILGGLRVRSWAQGETEG